MAAEDIQISMAPVAVWLSDTNMDPGPDHLHGLHWLLNIGINTDPVYCRALDPDMAPSSSTGLGVIMSPVSAQATQINMAPAAT